MGAQTCPKTDVPCHIGSLKNLNFIMTISIAQNSKFGAHIKDTQQQKQIDLKKFIFDFFPLD